MAIRGYDPTTAPTTAPVPAPASPGNGLGIEGTGKRYERPSSEAMGWKAVVEQAAAEHRLITSLEGERKSGKLHTALTFPEPIYLHSFDIGTEGVLEKFLRPPFGPKRIYLAEYAEPDQMKRMGGEKSDVQEEAKRVWRTFESQYYDSLASTRKQGTVIVDKGGQAYEMLYLAEFGRTEKILPRQRGVPNARMAAIARAAYGSKNAVWLHDVKAEYADATDPATGQVIWDSERNEAKSYKTGKMIMRGFQEFPFIVQLVGRCERFDFTAFTPGPNGEKVGSQFTVRCTDSRHNPMCHGLVVENKFESLVWAAHEYTGD